MQPVQDSAAPIDESACAQVGQAVHERVYAGIAPGTATSMDAAISARVPEAIQSQISETTSTLNGRHLQGRAPAMAGACLT